MGREAPALSTHFYVRCKLLCLCSCPYPLLWRSIFAESQGTGRLNKARARAPETGQWQNMSSCPLCSLATPLASQITPFQRVHLYTAFFPSMPSYLSSTSTPLNKCRHINTTPLNKAEPPTLIFSLVIVAGLIWDAMIMGILPHSSVVSSMASPSVGTVENMLDREVSRGPGSFLLYVNTIWEGKKAKSLLNGDHQCTDSSNIFTLFGWICANEATYLCLPFEIAKEGLLKQDWL